MKHFFDNILYYLGEIGIVFIYLLYFIFSWIIAFTAIPLMITYWFILKLFNRHPGPLSNMIKINKRNP